MAIPGQRADQEIRGKVKTGELRKSERTGRTYPASVDYFISDDAEFQRLCPGKPQTIRIVPAFDSSEEFFATGMEWWTKQRNGQNHLACYTKDSGDAPVALRSEPYLDEGLTIVGEKKGERVPILCPFRGCSHFKKKGDKPADCRPMGRLTFHLYGEAPGLAPLRLDTKSWNSIEEIEKALKRRAANLLTELVFDLSVAYRTEGDSKFPVLSIQEADVKVNTMEEVEGVDHLLNLQREQDDLGARVALANYLDSTRSGWRDDPAVVARIQAIGAPQVVANLLANLDDPSEL